MIWFYNCFSCCCCAKYDSHETYLLGTFVRRRSWSSWGLVVTTSSTCWYVKVCSWWWQWVCQPCQWLSQSSLFVYVPPGPRPLGCPPSSALLPSVWSVVFSASPARRTKSALPAVAVRCCRVNAAQIRTSRTVRYLTLGTGTPPWTMCSGNSARLVHWTRAGKITVSKSEYCRLCRYTDSGTSSLI